ncbi:MAG: SIR2 family protein [Deltaproteobacteria bacterium]|nr:SIR2 family protein [Deltaproteobacteria bacterium]
MPIAQQSFLNSFLKALEEGTAAVFAGAGLSKPSGFVDWRALLADIIRDLKLDPGAENNLVAAAQYSVNERAGNRGHLNQLLIEEFTKDATPNKNHELLARLPIDTIWTTNYDTMIEHALGAEYKRVDVKHRPEQLATSMPGRHVTLYKMHGDISAPDQAVLVKEDYETYEASRQLFSFKLQGDLVSKTFLFIGFSFTDPNIDYLLSRIRGLMGKNVREHYCFLKHVDPPSEDSPAAKAEFEYNKRRQELLVGDLKRYGIRTLLLNSYGEITTLLGELNNLVYRKNVFVSGSAADPDPLGEQRLAELCYALGKSVIQSGKNITSGMGVGVGGDIVLGALESLYRLRGGRVDERLTLRPFPQEAPEGMTLPEVWRRYREEMLAHAGPVVFIAGNKVVDGQVIIANGCLEEFEIAKALRRTPIPIGCTGHAAAQIWSEVSNAVGTYFPSDPTAATRLLTKLNDAGATTKELVDATLSLIEIAGRPA